MKIRDYTPADRDTVLALVVDVLAEHGFARGVDVSRGVERDLADVASGYSASRGGGFWVADDDGVVGTVAIRPKSDGVCELKRLYLRADQRGTGLGQRLYEH